MTVEDAAGALGISTHVVYDLLAEGPLTGQKRPDSNNPRTKTLGH
jgi:hypothetical protein